LSATVLLPRVLSQVTTSGRRCEAEGDSLGEVLESLFSLEPALRPHLLDEEGSIRPHVLIFVDSSRADLGTPVGPGSEVQVIQAVSGG
jgi:molybdopterin converting factor small subunit